MRKLKAKTGIVAAKAELKTRKTKTSIYTGLEKDVLIGNPYFQARENERFAGVSRRKVESGIMKRTRTNKGKKIVGRKLKGLAGIAKAAASTDNIKPRGRNLYSEFCFEIDWAGMHSFEHGVVGPGYFKRIREREKKFSELGKKAKNEK